MKGKSGSARLSNLSNLLVGWLLYPAGDLIGQVVMKEPSLSRFLAIMLAGGLLYRLEIPAWFNYLERLSISKERVQRHPALALLFSEHLDCMKLNWLGRTTGSMLYFNPLWIARHIAIIMLATTPFPELSLKTLALTSLTTGLKSFCTNLPIAFVGNYLLQQHVPLRYRFLGSAFLTTILTIKYAIEFRWFN